MRKLVDSILSTGRIGYGPISLAFEKRFAQIHDSAYGILSNSGTSSLQVALQAVKEVRRWEWGQVIVPATTFVATPNIVTHNKMVPKFVDVDPNTYNMDPRLLERAINKETKAIIPVHLFGQPANMTEIQAIADKHGIEIIEDSCESMFVSHAGKPVGSWGTVGCFSLYVAHLVVAGVGGIALTSEPAIAAKMRSLVNHGLSIENLNPGSNYAPQPMLGRHFVFDTVGHSYRITEFEAAVALAQLDDYEDMLGKRRRNAKHLTAGLEALNEHYGPRFQTPVIGENNEHAFMMYPIVLQTGDDTEKPKITEYLNNMGIETRDMLPLVNQPIFKYLSPDDYPVSKRLITHGFYVGVHQDLEKEDIGYMVDVFGKWINPEHQGIYLGKE